MNLKEEFGPDHMLEDFGVESQEPQKGSAGINCLNKKNTGIPKSF